MPKVTVLMPVFNGETYLRGAIESILGQTFSDYEFLIVDDGSTDKSLEIIASYEDPRIRLHANGSNRGTVHALNTGLELAKGEYIARMDCDDISLPHRLEQQVRFMDAHPHIGVCGSGMRHIKGDKLRNFRYQPTSDQELKITLLFNTCFFHPTVIMKKTVLNGALYPDNLIYTQDYNLWTHLAVKTDFANLRQSLLYFREHPAQISHRKAVLQKSNARLIRKLYLQSIVDDFNDEELEIHHQIAETRTGLDLEKTKKWLEHLVDINRQKRVFSPEVFLKEMSRKWWHCCKKNTQYGKETLDIYRSSYLHLHYRPEKLKYLKFYSRSLVRHRNKKSD
ncbi:glycosyl transferase [Prosthecochloris marina]|uniref:Glycosyl transferase n=1 Tax=Prosthecochloris marina TaxID=2017681 RepID=A0A317T6U9_9CHLB|nr:glycosyltransferase family A protein [Prosthecochloris marina]PWW82344.1 glycosyl transferase [Prosthecochloris marina]